MCSHLFGNGHRHNFSCAFIAVIAGRDVFSLVKLENLPPKGFAINIASEVNEVIRIVGHSQLAAERGARAEVKFSVRLDAGFS